MTPLVLHARIGQAIASVGKKPDEQLSMADLKVIALVWAELIHEARGEVCIHQHRVSGFCLDCDRQVEQKEAVK